MGLDSVSLSLTPHGRLLLTHDADAPPLGAGLEDRLIKAFERGSGHGLLLLGASEAGTVLPPVWPYWLKFGAHYVTALCTRQDGEGASQKTSVAPEPDEALERMVLAAPPM